MPPVLYHEGAFPPEVDWASLVPFIGPASAAIARYDGILTAIPSPALLLSPLTTQEAVLSSRIEGTQATMGEVLEFEAGQAPLTSERRDDINEVLNYRRAMAAATEALATLPLSGRVIREAHAVLLDGVRGQNRAPGQFRRTPVWIGPPGCTPEDCHFTPISAEKLPDAFGRWEQYLHSEQPDQLVQLALLHVEFEALHPFMDGNGRLGRMLIPLYLWQVGLISQPIFYISAYFEEHRDAYYESLLSVSRDGDWSGWCRFFLRAVQTQADDNLQKAKAILDLYRDLKGRMVEMTRSPFGVQALDWVFSQPIFKTTDFLARMGTSGRTARRLLDVLRREGVLRVLVAGGGRRPTILIFPALLNVAEGRDVFE
jgi:Fic family protein